jgi:hypothetical protein
MRSFHSGEPKALTKQKELAVHQALVKAGVQFEYQHHIPFATCGLGSESRCAYVDFVITKPWGYICLEIDEFAHSAYDPTCDARRDADILSSVALGSGGKVLLLRYNPDRFTIGGLTYTVPQKDRIARLLEVLDMEPEGCARWFLFYPKKEMTDTLPAVAEHWPLCMRGLSRCV